MLLHRTGSQLSTTHSLMLQCGVKINLMNSLIMYKHWNRNVCPPSLLFAFIYGYHVCNYNVNLVHGSVLFFFFFSLWHMELSQPIIAYFAMGNYRVGSSRVYTHSVFLCPLVLFTALLLNGLLCVSLVEPQRDSVQWTQSSRLSAKHLLSQVSLVL